MPTGHPAAKSRVECGKRTTSRTVGYAQYVSRHMGSVPKKRGVPRAPLFAFADLFFKRLTFAFCSGISWAGVLSDMIDDYTGNIFSRGSLDSFQTRRRVDFHDNRAMI